MILDMHTVTVHAKMGGMKIIGTGSTNKNIYIKKTDRLAWPDGKENLSGPIVESLAAAAGRRRLTYAFKKAITIMSIIRAVKINFVHKYILSASWLCLNTKLILPISKLACNWYKLGTPRNHIDPKQTTNQAIPLQEIYEEMIESNLTFNKSEHFENINTSNNL